MVVATSIASAPAAAQKLIRFSTSSQIAMAYGIGIVKEYEEMTGIVTQRYVGPTDTVIQRLKNGVSDIVAIDRPLPYNLKAGGYVEIPFCSDGIAIITNTQCTMTAPCNIDDLSLAQVRGIFSGKIDNWKALGGPDQNIIVIVPDATEGAYQNFQDLVMHVNEIKYHFMARDATIALEAIKFVPGAVSFVAQSVLANEKSIKTIKVDGKSPRDPAYPVKQTYAFVTQGAPKGKIKSVINFGLSPRGIEIMKSKGMQPILK